MNEICTKTLALIKHSFLALWLLMTESVQMVRSEKLYKATEFYKGKQKATAYKVANILTVFLLAICFTVGMGVPKAEAAMIKVWDTEEYGNMEVIGAQARRYQSTWYKYDTTDSAVYSSSGARLTLPSGSTVLKAYLVWSGQHAAGSTVAKTSTLYFKTPIMPATLAGSTKITSQGYQQNNQYCGYYADVTSLVQSGGTGWYYVYNPKGDTISLPQAQGWSLYVYYKNTAEKYRFMSFYYGAHYVDRTLISFTVTGIKTPVSGPVTGRFASTVFWSTPGEADWVKVNGTQLSGYKTPANDFANDAWVSHGTDLVMKPPAGTAGLREFQTKMLDLSGNEIGNNLTSVKFDLWCAGSDSWLGLGWTFDLLDAIPKMEKTAVNVTDPTSVPQKDDIIEYTVKLTSQGTKSKDAYIEDVLPAGVTYVAGSLKIHSNTTGMTNGALTDAIDGDVGNVTGNTIRVNIGTGATGTAGGNMDVGKEVVIKFQVKVNGTTPAGQNIVNEAKGYLTSLDTGKIGAGTSTSTSTMNPFVSKEVDRSKIVVGDTVTYKVTIKNGGSDPWANVQVTDTPQNLTAFTYVTGSTKVNGGAAGNPIIIGGKLLFQPIPSVAAGQNIELTYQMKAGATAPAGTYKNTAYANFTLAGKTYKTANREATVEIIPEDLTKTSDKPFIIKGEEVTYTVTLKNTSGGVLTAAKVIDTPDLTKFTYKANSATVNGIAQEPTIAGNTLTFNAPNPLADGATVTVVYTLTANANIPGDEYTNKVKANLDGIVTNEVEEKITVTELSKVANPTTIFAGNTVSYTVTFKNTGKVAINTLTLVDKPDLTNFTYVNGTAKLGGIGIADPTVVGGKLTFAGGVNVAPGATVTLTYDMISMSNAPIGNYPNKVHGEIVAGTENGSTGEAQATVKIIEESLKKEANKNYIIAGDEVTYTVTLENTTGGAVTSTKIIDTPDLTKFTYKTGSGKVNGVAQNPTIAGNVMTFNETATVANGAKVTVVYTLIANATTAGGEYTNKVKATMDGITTSEKTEKVIVTELSKTASPTTIFAGNTVTYTVKAKNTGTTAIDTLKLVDTPNLTHFTYKAGSAKVDGVGIADPVSAGGKLTFTAGTNVPANTEVILTYEMIAKATIPAGSYPNKVYGEITVGSETDTTGEKTSTVKVVSNGVTKQSDKDYIIAGDEVTYTVAVQNTTGAAVTSSKIIDTPDLTNFTYKTGSGSVNGVAQNPTIVGNTMTFNGPATVADGATVTVVYTLTANTNIAGGEYSNKVTATLDGATTPEITDKVTVVDLAKTASPTTIFPGNTVTYTVKATNNGQVAVNSLKLVDTPDLTNFTYKAGSAKVGGVGIADPVIAGGTLTFTAGTNVAANATVTLTYEMTSIATIPVGSYKNKVHGEMTVGTKTSSTGEKEATVKVINGAVTKEANSKYIVAGQEVTYTVTVQNTTGNTITSTKIIDTTDLTKFSYKGGSGTVNGIAQTPTIVGNVITFNGPASLANGATVTVVYTLVANTNIAGGEYSNKVTANLDGITTPEIEEKIAVVELAKTANPTTIFAGNTVTYTVTAKNTSQVTIDTFKLVDKPDLVNFTYKAGTAKIGGIGIADPVIAGGTLTFAAGSNVAPNAVVTLTYEMISNTNVPAGSYVNKVHGEMIVGTKNSTTDEKTATVKVITDGVTKEANTKYIVAGDDVTYTVKVQNTTGATVTNTKIIDTPDLTNFTYKTGSGTINGIAQTPAIVGNTLTFNGPSPLLNGATVTLVYTLTANTNIAGGEYSNKVKATLDGITTPEIEEKIAVVELTKAVSPSAIYAGNTATYTVTAQNTSQVTIDTLKLVDKPDLVNFTYKPGSAKIGGVGIADPVIAGGTLTFAAGSNVAPNAVVTLTYEMISNTNIPVGSYVNKVHGEMTVGTKNSTTGEKTATVKVVANGVTKEANTNYIVAGDEVTYTVTVQNTTGATVTNTKIIDTPDLTNFTYKPGSGTVNGAAQTPTFAGNTMTFNGPATVANGATVTVVYTLVANTTISGGEYSNKVQATLDGATTPEITEKVAVVELAKTANPSTIFPGNTVTYAVTAQNTSQVTINTLKLVDKPDLVNFTYKPGTAKVGGVAIADPVIAGGTLTFTAGTNVAANATVTLTYEMTSIATIPVGSYKNKVHGEMTVGTKTSSTGEKEATVKVINGAVTKEANSKYIVAGQEVTYTVTVQNTTGNTITSTKIIDTPDLSKFSYKGGSGTVNGIAQTPTIVGNVITFNGPASLANGATVTVVYTLVANTNIAGGEYSNKVTANLDGITTPPIEEKIAVVELAKTANPTTIFAGNTVTYTVTAKNTSQVTIDTFKLVDKPDLVNFTYKPGTAKIGGIGIADPVIAGGTLTFAAGSNVAPNAVVTLTYEMISNANIPAGNYVNKVHGEMTVGTKNSTTDEKTSTVKVAAGGVTKESDKNYIVAGDEVTYTVTVQNTTGSTITSTKIIDTPDLTKFTYKTGSGTVNGLAQAPVIVGNTLTFNGPTPLMNGATVTLIYTLTANANIAGAEYSNKVKATLDGITTPEIEEKIAVVDLAKSASPSTIYAGNTVTYTVTAKNTSQVAIDSLKLIDKPDLVNFTYKPGTAKIGGVGIADPVNAGGTLTFAAGSNVAPNAVVTLTYEMVSNTNIPVGSYVNKVHGELTVGTKTDVTGEKTATVKVVADGVTKEANTNYIVAGDEVTYTVKVQNTTGAAITNTKIIDTPDMTKFTYKPGSGTVNGAAQIPTFAGNTMTFVGPSPLANGATVTVVYTLIANTTIAGGEYSNTAKAELDGTTTPEIEEKVAVVGLSKTANPSTIFPGNTVTYTVTAQNTSQVTINTLKLVDKPDLVNFTYKPGTAKIGGVAIADPVIAGGTLTFTAGTNVAANATVTLTYEMTSIATIPVGSYKNKVHGEMTVGTKTSTTGEKEATVTVVNGAVTKEANTAFIVAGDEVTYTVTVQNTTGGTITSTKIIDTPDLTKFTYKTGSGKVNGIAQNPAIVGNVMTFTGPASLANGATVTVEYILTANANIAGGEYSNSVTADLDGITTPPVEEKITVAELSKTANPTTIFPGNTVTYTVTAKNSGQTTIDTMKLVDAPDLVNFTYKLGTAKVGGVGIADPVNAGGKLTFTVGTNVVPGTTLTLTYEMESKANIPVGSYKNKVHGEMTVGADASITGEKEATVKVVTGGVTKEANKAFIIAGDEVTYTVTVANTTGGTVTSTKIIDTPDLTKFTYKTGSGKVDGIAQNPVIVGNTMTFTGPSPLANGATVTVVYTLVANTTIAGGEYSNKVEATLDGITTPPVEEKITVAELAKTVNPTTIYAGNTVTYTVTAKNAGQTTVNTMKLVDTPDLSNFTYTLGSAKVDGVAIADPVNAGGNLTFTVGTNVAPGTTLTLTYEMVSKTNIPLGSYKNTVYGEMTVGTDTSTTGKKEATVTVIDNTLTKESDKNYIIAGEEVTYTVKVQNTTGAAITNTKIIDTPDLTKFTYKTGSGKVNGAAQTPVIAGNTMTFTGPSPLANGAIVTVEYTLIANSNIAGDEYSNKVQATLDGMTTPEIIDKVTVVDLAKSASPSTIFAGNTVTYTVTAKNTGSTIVNAMKLIDKPDLVNFTYKTSSAKINGAPIADPVIAGGTLTFATVNNVAPSAVVTLTYEMISNATVPAGSYKNEVKAELTVNGKTDTTDKKEATVTVVTGSLTKESDKNYIVAGEEVTYKVTLTNTIGSAVTSTKIVDTPDLTNFTYKAGSGKVNGAAQTPVISGNTMTFTGPSPLANGATVIVEYTLTANATIAGGEYSNKVTATLDGITTPETEDKIAVVDLAKTASPSTIFAGNTVTYTVTAKNTGLVAIDTFKLVDSPDLSNFTYKAGTAKVNGAAISDPAIAGGKLTFIGGTNVAPGATLTLTYEMTSLATIPAGTYKNKVHGELTVGTKTDKTEEKEATVTVVGESVTKEANKSFILAGEEVTYTVTVMNTTGTTVSSAKVIDTADLTNFTYKPGSGKVDGATQNPALAGNVMTFTVPTTVAAGATVTVEYTLVANTTIAGGEYSNKVKAELDGITTTETEEKITVMELSKSASPSTIFAGNTVTYTVTAKNSGQTTINTMKLVDTPDLSNFTYTLGSAKVNGASIADPSTAGGKLTFTVGTNVTPGTTLTLTYDMVSKATVAVGIYKNKVHGEITVGTDTSTTGEKEATVKVIPDSIKKESNKSFILAGEEVTYTVTVKNTTGGTVTTTKIIDTPDLTKFSYKTGSGKVNGLVQTPVIVGNTMTFTGPAALADGATVTVEYILVANATIAGGEYSNKATASLDGLKTPEIEEKVTVVELDKVVNPSTIYLGDQATYQVTLKNTGTTAWDNVKIIDTPDPAFAFVTGSAEMNGMAVADPTVSGGKLIFTAPYPSVPAGMIITLTYKMEMTTPTVGTYTNKVFSEIVVGSDTSTTGEKEATVTVTNDPTLAINGTVFEDVNKNGAWNSGTDKPIPTYTVTLKDGITGAVVDTTTTDANGYYSFTNLVRNHSYKVEVNMTSRLTNGWRETTPTPTNTASVSERVISLGTAPVANQDFGYAVEGLLSGTVVVDIDQTNNVSAGDIKVGNAIILATHSDGTTRTATTDSNGYYEIVGVKPGQWTVSVQSIPAPYAGNVNISFAGTTVGATTVVANVTNTSVTGIDFGLIGKNTVKGNVYYDYDSTGVHDPVNDLPIPGVEMKIYIAGTNTVVGTAFTDANGEYVFTNLANHNTAGVDYEIKVASLPVAGLKLSYGTLPLPVEIAGAPNPQIMAPIGYDGTLTIKGKVFHDANANDAYDPGEGAPAAGPLQVKIRFKTAGGAWTGALNRSIVAAANGDYELTGLIPGEYSVELTVVSQGALITNRFQASYDYDDAAGATPATPHVAKLRLPTTRAIVPQRVALTDVNFAYVYGGSIESAVYLDANNDGAQDPGDTPLAGVDVTLTWNGGANSLVATTNAQGIATFKNLDETILDYKLITTYGLAAGSGKPLAQTLYSYAGTGTHTDAGGGVAAGGDVTLNVDVNGLTTVTKANAYFGFKMNNQPVTITKKAGKDSARVGEFVPYTITVTNNGTDPIPDISVKDYIPAGFKYVKGSARYTNLTTGETRAFVNDPVDARPIVFEKFMDLQPGASARITYLLVVGSGVTPGEYVNKAYSLNQFGFQNSNVASATVKVIGDPLFDDSLIFGKVFHDKNRNGRQDKDEPGVGGVKLVTARGEIITTDENGRYHLADVSGGRWERGTNFILKLDTRSLPQGLTTTTENPVVARLSPGLPSRINFGVEVPPPVAARLAEQLALRKVEEVKKIEEKLQKEEKFVVESIHFAFDEDRIEPEFENTLDSLAEVLRLHPEWKIRIEGHTDFIGSEAYNKDLSQRRANSVKAYLLKTGVNPTQLVDAVGLGLGEPIADNGTPEGRYKNRRVEFKLEK